MRYIVLFCALLFSWLNACADADTTAPYLKKPERPDFSIRLLDSTTIFHTAQLPKNRPTLFILFSPDCDHCSKLARQVADSLAAFDGVNLCLVSPPARLYDIRMFAHLNGVANKPRIVVGEDKEFFFGSFFHASTVPFVVLYDRRQRFVAVLKAVRSVSEILAALRQL